MPLLLGGSAHGTRPHPVPAATATVPPGWEGKGQGKGRGGRQTLLGKPAPCHQSVQTADFCPQEGTAETHLVINEVGEVYPDEEQSSCVNEGNSVSE